MIRKIAAGMAIAALALTGCADKKEISGLKTAARAMADDIAYLNARIQAVETACLQLNDKISGLENHRESKGVRSADAAGKTSLENSAGPPAAINPSPADTAPAENKPAPAPSTEAGAARPLTSDSFSYTISGLRPETIQKMFGQPDQIKKVADDETWIYSRIKLQGVQGGSETRPALVVFKKGRVSHGILTQEVQYELQMEKPAPGATNAAD